MAINIPSNLYTVGAVKLDSSSSANAYGRLLAQKQAKQEALDKYFTDLQGKINTAGVRIDKDMPGIQKDINDWASMWPTVKNGGVAERQAFLSKYQNVLSRIEQSKQRGKTEMEIGKMRAEGKYDPIDDDMHVLDNVSKSIYDPSSYKSNGSEYGWADLSPSIPDFDESKFLKSIKEGKSPGEQLDFSKGTRDKDTGLIIVPFVEKYSSEQIKDAADRVGMMNIDSGTGEFERSARKKYGSIVDNPKSDVWMKLNPVYQSVYGKDSIVDTPTKAAQAAIILDMSSPSKVSTKTFSDYDLKKNDALFKMAYNSGLIASRGGEKESEKTRPLNLTNYKKEGDNYDVSKLMAGIRVRQSSGSGVAKKILYNPQTREVTVFESMNKPSETYDWDTFRQNISTLNTGTDLSVVDRLGNTREVVQSKPQGKSNWRDRAKPVK